MNMICSFRRVIAFCAVNLLIATGAFAFEGRVDMTMTNPTNSGVIPVTYYMKGHMMRIEMQLASADQNQGMNSVATLFDMDKMEMLILMPQQKMYMVMNIKKEVEKVEQDTKKQTDFKPTGRKEKIIGVTAEEYVGVSENRQTDIWLTKELGRFMMANQGKGKSRSTGWQKFLEGEDAFALRVVQHDSPNGPEVYRLEVTKVDRSSPDSSLFAPPPDYNKFEMGGLGDALKGMMGNH